ncbi:Lactoylglutathione lyase (plasmid) [Cupriavidus taiwanensis]|uniref:Aldoketomutase n=2 Tax=Cupriavidus taiwanensis TaxID=164546 RepID=A0A375IPG9_9BURK|nr:Lactoylglutathione lyase [Cupriavidus taiwanensis]
MIRVHDLDRSLSFYADALGLSTSHRLDFSDFSLVYLRNNENDFELELTWNKDREPAYTHGDGYGHIAVAVSALKSEHERMSALGFAPTPIKEFKRGDEMLARFFFIQDPDGYKIEVLERAGHYI